MTDFVVSFRFLRSYCTIRLDRALVGRARGLPRIKALHVLPCLSSGGAERLAPNFLEALNR